jgi:CRP/FNR family transcriptional regulator
MSVSDWIAQFPALSRLEPDLRSLLEKSSHILKVKKNTTVFGPGKAPEYLLLLLDGTVRVQQTSETGREIVLYRVSTGESCILTTACLLAHEDYQALGIAETDVTAVAIQRSTFDELIAKSSVFRRFVFAAFSQRMTDIFRLVDEVAFHRIDIRLAQKLLQLAGEGSQISITHQQLAAELGTAREVVSRQLQEFQRRNWVLIGRGSLAITNPSELQKLSHHS